MVLNGKFDEIMATHDKVLTLPALFKKELDAIVDHF